MSKDGQKHTNAKTNTNTLRRLSYFLVFDILGTVSMWLSDMFLFCTLIAVTIDPLASWFHHGKLSNSLGTDEYRAALGGKVHQKMPWLPT